MKALFELPVPRRAHLSDDIYCADAVDIAILSRQESSRSQTVDNRLSRTDWFRTTGFSLRANDSSFIRRSRACAIRTVQYLLRHGGACTANGPRNTAAATKEGSISCR